MMEVLLSEFLPTSWAASSSTPPQSVYGLPLAAAMKLLRVVATTGRHACARLVSVVLHSESIRYHSIPFVSLCHVVDVSLFAPQLNCVGARERLAHLLSAEPSELLLDPTEALRLTTEAYRLWAVAAGYGQACEMFVWVDACNSTDKCKQTEKTKQDRHCACSLFMKFQYFY